MESATIAAQGYRFQFLTARIMCIDKPLHGEINYPVRLTIFDEGAVSEHLQIVIESIELLKQAESKHSRKLNAMNHLSDKLY